MPESNPSVLPAVSASKNKNIMTTKSSSANLKSNLKRRIKEINADLGNVIVVKAKNELLGKANVILSLTESENYDTEYLWRMLSEFNREAVSFLFEFGMDQIIAQIFKITDYCRRRIWLRMDEAAAASAAASEVVEDVDSAPAAILQGDHEIGHAVDQCDQWVQPLFTLILSRTSGKLYR